MEQETLGLGFGGRGSLRGGSEGLTTRGSEWNTSLGRKWLWNAECTGQIPKADAEVRRQGVGQGRAPRGPL